jgi:hypothetical protein
MAIEIVDGLETVEVEDDHREALAGGGGAATDVVELGEELAPVGNLRERIEVGQAQVFVAQQCAVLTWASMRPVKSL